MTTWDKAERAERAPEPADSPPLDDLTRCALTLLRVLCLRQLEQEYGPRTHWAARNRPVPAGCPHWAAEHDARLGMLLADLERLTQLAELGLRR